MMHGSVIAALSQFYALLVVTLFVPIVAGLYGRPSRRAGLASLAGVPVLIVMQLATQRRRLRSADAGRHRSPRERPRLLARTGDTQPGQSPGTLNVECPRPRKAARYALLTLLTPLPVPESRPPMRTPDCPSSPPSSARLRPRSRAAECSQTIQIAPRRRPGNAAASRRLRGTAAVQDRHRHGSGDACCRPTAVARCGVRRCASSSSESGPKSALTDAQGRFEVRRPASRPLHRHGEQVGIHERPVRADQAV